MGEVQRRQDETKKLEEEMRANMAAEKNIASKTSIHNQDKEQSSTEPEWRIAEIDERLYIEKLMQIS